MPKPNQNSMGSEILTFFLLNRSVRPVYRRNGTTRARVVWARRTGNAR